MERNVLISFQSYSVANNRLFTMGISEHVSFFLFFISLCAGVNACNLSVMGRCNFISEIYFCCDTFSLIASWCRKDFMVLVSNGLFITQTHQTWQASHFLL